MRIYPTRITFHVAGAGVLMLLVGVVWKVPVLAAFGAAVVLTIAIGKRLAQGSVEHLREAGFEMVWKTKGRITRLTQGGTTEVHLELRNRARDDLRGLDVRVLASEGVVTSISPRSIDLPGGASTLLTVQVQAPRVGRFGLHGIALDVRGIPVGGDSLYEAPLMFANPHGIEVLPLIRTGKLDTHRGARTRTGRGGKGTLRGDGDDFRELRDHTAQDSFRHIAWKASAKRGKWLVRVTESTSQQSTLVLLETSGEAVSGPSGHTPFDQLLPRAYATLTAAHGRGDTLVFATFCSKLNAWADSKKWKRSELLETLREVILTSTSFHEAHRTPLLESMIAEQIREHLRPLDPEGLRGVDPSSIDALADRADRLKHRAPFQARAPRASTLREQRLRHYAQVFGIDFPPAFVDVTPGLVAALQRAEQRKASRVEVFAAPPKSMMVFEIVRRMVRSGTHVHWTMAATPPRLQGADPLLATEAASTRSTLVAALSRRELAACGVRVSVIEQQAREEQNAPTQAIAV